MGIPSVYKSQCNAERNHCAKMFVALQLWLLSQIFFYNIPAKPLEVKTNLVDMEIASVLNNFLMQFDQLELANTTKTPEQVKPSTTTPIPTSTTTPNPTKTPKVPKNSIIVTTTERECIGAKVYAQTNIEFNVWTAPLQYWLLKPKVGLNG
jgi:hypothetical protein